MEPTIIQGRPKFANLQSGRKKKNAWGFWSWCCCGSMLVSGDWGGYIVWGGIAHVLGRSQSWVGLLYKAVGWMEYFFTTRVCDMTVHDKALWRTRWDPYTCVVCDTYHTTHVYIWWGWCGWHHGTARSACASLLDGITAGYAGSAAIQVTPDSSVSIQLSPMRK